MAFTKNDEAVSPVIGVILMVAITVILAAVIAAFVFGMAGNVQSAKIVSITATKDAAGSITVTNMGGSDLASLTTVSVKIADGAAAATGPTQIGQVVKYSGSTAAQRVLIVGSFSDGSQQILLDKTL